MSLNVKYRKACPRRRNYITQNREPVGIICLNVRCGQGHVHQDYVKRNNARFQIRRADRGHAALNLIVTSIAGLSEFSSIGEANRSMPRAWAGRPAVEPSAYF